MQQPGQPDFETSRALPGRTGRSVFYSANNVPFSSITSSTTCALCGIPKFRVDREEEPFLIFLWNDVTFHCLGSTRRTVLMKMTHVYKYVLLYVWRGGVNSSKIRGGRWRVVRKGVIRQRLNALLGSVLRKSWTRKYRHWVTPNKKLLNHFVTFDRSVITHDFVRGHPRPNPRLRPRNRGSTGRLQLEDSVFLGTRVLRTSRRGNAGVGKSVRLSDSLPCFAPLAMKSPSHPTSISLQFVQGTTVLLLDLLPTFSFGITEKYWFFSFSVDQFLFNAGQI